MACYGDNPNHNMKAGVDVVNNVQNDKSSEVCLLWYQNNKERQFAKPANQSINRYTDKTFNNLMRLLDVASGDVEQIGKEQRYCSANIKEM